MSSVRRAPPRNESSFCATTSSAWPPSCRNVMSIADGTARFSRPSGPLELVRGDDLGVHELLDGLGEHVGQESTCGDVAGLIDVHASTEIGGMGVENASVQRVRVIAPRIGLHGE